MKILFTGGGTAGHILPIIAIVREIRKIYTKDDLKIYYIGPKDDFGGILLAQEGIQVKTILAGKIRRYFTIKSFFQNIVDVFFRIPLGTVQAFFIIFFIAPDLTFCKGGYGAIPATFASWILRIPIFLHESDVVPGMANRFLSKFAFEIFVAFPIKRMMHFPPNKMIMVGNPVRRELLEGNIAEAKEFFDLSGEKPVVLVLGGSQGAQKINDMILEILPAMLEDFEVIHQCGEKKFQQVNTESRIMVKNEMEKYYHLYPFLKEEELKNAYAASQIIVSRAGASSIFEIATLGKPSILIPLANSAQNHQVENAYTYAENGASFVIEESNLTPRFFMEKLKFLITRPNELEKMQREAREFSKPMAARLIAEYIISYLI